MSVKYTELNDIFNSSSKIVLTTHVVPDGDAIGSEMALKRFLEKKYKNPEVINHSNTPENLKFLDPEDSIRVFENDRDENEELIANADLIVLLDINEFSRTRSMEPSLLNSGAKKICIDHHQDIKLENYNFAISDPESPSTCQILYDYMITEAPDVIDKRISEALYTGIITDTGSFRYPRTTEETFLSCAELVRRGADPVGIYEKIYNENSINKIRLMAKYLESFEFHFDDRLGLGIITDGDFKETLADQTDIEGFSSIMMSIKGIVMSIMLVELPHSIKISLRSKGEIKVNEIAKEFGGGGHKNAAGASYFKGDISELKTKVLSVAKNYLNQIT